MITLTNVNFVRERRHILKDVNLRMNRGEQWVVLGRNGSGKTTILEMINGYLFPTSGHIEVLGERYGEADVRKVRRRIGYISQSMMEKLTLRDPLWEVVATGALGILRFYEPVAAQLEEEARAMLERHGLSAMADQPLGLLSQGERKKAMLARTLMQRPEILILDEPCAGLDLYEREQFLRMFGSLKDQGMSIVYVTHHLEEIIPLFTHIALIHEGRVAAAGPKTEILTEERIGRIYDVPVRLDWQDGRPWLQVRA